MTTGKSSRIYVRQAKPLDAVNIYKLMIDEEKRTDTGYPHDDAARLIEIVKVISTGYVSVAEKSGRVVASLGFEAADYPTGTQRFLNSKWYLLQPSLRKTDIPRLLTKKLTEFADMHGAPLHVAIPAAEKDLAGLLSDFGFQAKLTYLIRDPNVRDELPELPEDEPEVPLPATTGD